MYALELLSVIGAKTLLVAKVMHLNYSDSDCDIDCGCDRGCDLLVSRVSDCETRSCKFVIYMQIV
jgi:hypothetical protein